MDIHARVKMLESLIIKAKKLGFSKVIGDLILEPSNVLESFIAYHDFAIKNPNVPLLVGVANVTELMDADSVGLNALLARLCSEVNASILLSTQKSTKTKGSIKETVTASKMMFLAKKRSSIPKGLGLDLLTLKDKNSNEEPYNRALEFQSKVIVSEDSKLALMDPAGMFKITVDREEEMLVALHFKTTQLDKPVSVIKGKTAEKVYSKIVALGLVSLLDHAAYLGRELGKAEIALRAGKVFVQDEPLFR